MAANDPRNLKSVREIARPDILFTVARLPNSSRLLVGSSSGKVLAIDAADAKGPVKELADHKRYVTSLVLAGRIVVSGSYDGKLIWWDLDKEKAVRTLAAHTKQIRQLAASPDGSKLASVGDDMVCRVWNAVDGGLIHELHGHLSQTPTHFTSMLYCCTFSPDGKQLATGDRIGHVVIWDAVTGKQVAAVETPTLYTWDSVQRIRSIGGVRALAFSPDGAHLAIGGVGQIKNVDGLGGPSRVEVFDWKRRDRIYEFTGAQGLVNRLVYQPSNQWLCALGGGNNGLVVFHDPKTRSTIHQGSMPMFVHDAVFNEDQTTLFAVGHQKIAVMELRG
jgi:WD40 repeat protein